MFEFVFFKMSVTNAKTKCVLAFSKFGTFLTFHFGAEEPGSAGPRNPGGGTILKEPGARAGPDSPPVALGYSKNPL